jgi:hypothetical protein
MKIASTPSFQPIVSNKPSALPGQGTSSLPADRTEISESRETTPKHSAKALLIGAAAVAVGGGALVTGILNAPAMVHSFSALPTYGKFVIGVPAALGGAVLGSAGLMAGAMANDSGSMGNGMATGVLIGSTAVMGAVGTALGGGVGLLAFKVLQAL